MPVLAQLDKGKSMIRYLAANETAGLAVFLVNASNLVPFPPARIIATTLFLFNIKSPPKINHIPLIKIIKEINFRFIYIEKSQKINFHKNNLLVVGYYLHHFFTVFAKRDTIST